MPHGKRAIHQARFEISVPALNYPIKVDMDFNYSYIRKLFSRCLSSALESSIISNPNYVHKENRGNEMLAKTLKAISKKEKERVNVGRFLKG